jgi:NADPH:quinone reductase-like Zn-dependent oxidoreductase
VHAAALNPTDLIVMRGFLRPQTGWRRPRQRVSGFDVGRAAVAGNMALEALRDHARLRAGQRIAITGATGGVGSFAVQIAKAWGAHVTAVCRTANVELARQLGPDRVFDYTHEDYLREERYDAIFDNGGGRSLRDLRRALAPGGVVVLNCGQDLSLIVAGYAARLVFRRRDVKQFVRKVTRADLLELAALVEDGSVTPVVARTYPLTETPAAISYLMARLRAARWS